MLPTNSGRFWVTWTVPGDSAPQPGWVWLCTRGASLYLQLFHCLFYSVMGPHFVSCISSQELLTCLNSRPFSMCISSELNVLQLQVSIQICDSLLCLPWLVLWARSDLPDAVFCSKIFLYIQLCEHQCMCYMCAGNIEYFSPESRLPDLLPTWEGKGTLETSCFPSSLSSPCAKWGSAS